MALTSSHSPSEIAGQPAQCLGWQGLSAVIPEIWVLTSFGGDKSKGNFRLADDDGLRLEAFWENPKGTPDVARSVELLFKSIEREAKKKKHAFSAIENPRLIPKTRKEHAGKAQLTNFGWSGDPDQVVSHGWGAAWFCEQSDRVVVVHVVGSGDENHEKTRRLAAEVLSSFQSHGTGGWELWSVFGLQMEIPEEFHLRAAKLQTGRIELDWERESRVSLLSPAEWGRRKEQIGLRRLSAANIVLENEPLEQWAGRAGVAFWRPYQFGKLSETEVLSHKGLHATGRLRDLRRYFIGLAMDRVFRRRTPPPEVAIWYDEDDNKLFALMTDLWPVNIGVRADILDSLQSRTI